MSRRWTKERLKSYRATMAAKKEAKNVLEAQKNFLAPPVETAQAQEDVHRNYEFHYRRGLVVAMECILRELR